MVIQSAYSAVALLRTNAEIWNCKGKSTKLSFLSASTTSMWNIYNLKSQIFITFY